MTVNPISPVVAVISKRGAVARPSGVLRRDDPSLQDLDTELKLKLAEYSMTYTKKINHAS